MLFPGVNQDIPGSHARGDVVNKQKDHALMPDHSPWRPPFMVAGAPSFQYFNVAIAAPDKAIEAAVKHLANSPEAETWEISVARKPSPVEVAALSLEAGQVKPA